MYSQEELIREEQTILNSLIREMDSIILKKNQKLTAAELQVKKAKNKCLPDTYGSLVQAQNEKKELRKAIKRTKQSRNELYEHRLELYVTDETSESIEEIKIGLHTYTYLDKVFIVSWTNPICQRFILDSSATDYNEKVLYKGQLYHTHYTLKMKRKIDMFFDKVTGVSHIYPLSDEESEKIIADEFLKELLSRRSETEFRNIVFSIQKQQGEIIQTPFKENLIVQGCAGSGKSMIMLHRLPIVLVNNPNGLDRNNMYIITPSITYIQMANNLRIDLEIEDLKMGTLEQYYDYVIQKYGISPSEYGTIYPYLKIDSNLEKYIYSDDCITDILSYFEAAIITGKIDYSSGRNLFTLKTQRTLSSTPYDKIISEILGTQEIITENEKILNQYHIYIRDVYEGLTDFSNLLRLRKTAVTRGIKKAISGDQDLIEEKEQELKTLDREKNGVAYQNRKNAIVAAQKRIDDLRETMLIVDWDDEYFHQLEKCSAFIQKSLELFPGFHKLREKMSTQNLYICVTNIDSFLKEYYKICAEIMKIGDPYSDYAESIENKINSIATVIKPLEYYDHGLLDFEYLTKLKESNSYFTDLRKSLVQNTYEKFMEQLGQTPDDKGRLKALNCSPYLYLQILYLFQGQPNAIPESLISIDEAQNVMPAELRLIQNVNLNKVILNLYGDVKQHIPNTKGIDSWNEIQNIAKFKMYDMRENYRNARQITEFCNRQFNLQMRAINTDGAGVHIVKDSADLLDKLQTIFTRPQNPGLSCIIVKNVQEAQSIITLSRKFSSRISNMVDVQAELQVAKWNLMTVEQAKGLEFETVFAVTGRMDKNEQYITYTRALNELFVYDSELAVVKVEKKSDTPPDIPEKSSSGMTKHVKRTKRSKASSDNASIPVSEFFKRSGFEVIDLRNKSGFLWVIGEKELLEETVNQAIQQYGITGIYGSGKATNFRAGWYTKTKK